MAGDSPLIVMFSDLPNESQTKDSTGIVGEKAEGEEASCLQMEIKPFVGMLGRVRVCTCMHLLGRLGGDRERERLSIRFISWDRP